MPPWALAFYNLPPRGIGARDRAPPDESTRGLGGARTFPLFALAGSILALTEQVFASSAQRLVVVAALGVGITTLLTAKVLLVASKAAMVSFGDAGTYASAALLGATERTSMRSRSPWRVSRAKGCRPGWRRRRS